jgi:Lar family restriction alleviation protein
MSEAKTNALKPCPFCGAEPNYTAYGNTKHQVECGNSDCAMNVGTFTHMTREACFAAWNKRHGI